MGPSPLDPPDATRPDDAPTAPPVRRVRELAGVARTLDELLTGVVREVVASLPIASCAVVILVEGDVLRSRASCGIEVEESFALHVGEGFSGIIAQTGVPLLVVDPASDPRVRSSALRAGGLRSVFGVPLRAGEVVGVLYVGSRTTEAWTPADCADVVEIAAHVSPAVALHVVRADAERRARQQATVAELGRFALSASGGRSVLLERAAHAVKEGLEGPCVALLEVVPSPDGGRHFLVHAAVGWSDQELVDVATAADDAIHARAVTGGEPVIVEEIGETTTFAFAERARELRSALAVPIPLGPTRTFGAVVAHSKTRAAFAASHVDFVVAIANILGESLLRRDEQERLRRSEETLRLAAEAAAVGTWEWSVETGELSWSAVTKEIYGLARDEEVDYARFVGFLPDAERAAVERLVADALRPDGPGRMDFEHRMRRADGAMRWLSAHAQTLFDEQRRPVRVVGTTVDVTDEKRSAELQDFVALASAELAISLDVSETVRVVAGLPLPTIADVALVGLFEGEAELDWVAVRAAGTARAEVAARLERAGSAPRSAALRGGRFGASPARLFAEVDDEALRWLAEDPPRLELLRGLALRSMMLVPLVARGRAFGVLALGAAGRRYDDLDLGMLEAFGARAALAIDNARLFADQVVAREAAEAARAALATSEERRRLALDAARLGTWQWDATSGLVEVDARARALLGVAQEVAITPSAFLATLHPEDRPRLAEDLRLAGERREVTVTFDFRVLQGGGGVRWLSGAGRVEADASGRPLRWTGTLQDVTQRKLDEQQAAAASRAKDEFLAMLGHELRNPLAPIATAVQLMKMRGGKADERERSIIERQVRHLSRLVDDLLDVSRITAGRVKLDLAVLELNDVVAQAIETASPLLEKRRQNLVVSVPRTGLAVRGDAVRLAQVVANLLTNSAKYTHPGGHVRIAAEREGEQILLRVADDGMGISRELLPRVFDVFAQGSQAIDRSQGGLGLGLAIVKSLVTMHGGIVEAASEGEGKGTTMTVRLPAAKASVVANASELQAPRRAPSVAPRAKVLVVDDNVDAAEMLDEVLAAAGYEVVTAFEPLSAIEVATSFRPDIAVLDVGLPVMDGFELAARLRERPGLAALRLVAVTGYGQEEDRERAARAGFDAHLVKPVDVDRLTQVLARILA